MQETWVRFLGQKDRWVRKIPWRRKWQATPVSFPGKSHRQRNLVGNSPLGHKRVRHDLATQFSSVAQSCPTLCDPMNCSMPRLPLKASERAISLKRKPLPLRRYAWILGSYLKDHFCPTPTSWTAWLPLTYRASSYFQPDCQSPCSQVITEL